MFWYQSELNSAHEHVFSHVDAVESEQRDVHENNLCHARLYSNREEPGLGNGSRGSYRAGFYAVTENVIQSVVDAATALIAKSRPKVKVLTDGADWAQQQLARQLEKYVFGMFQALRVYDLLPIIFRDCCVWGTGALKLFTRNGQIMAERVLIDEIIVDEDEVPSGGMPRQLHQVRLVPRDVLRSLYPEHKDAIDRAGEQRRQFTTWRTTDPDMCAVIESWCLPIDDEHPGRHTICVDQATLLDEEYTRTWFPFIFLRWSPPLTGFYGQGLAEGLLGFQIRINELNDFIRKCQDLVAVPRVAVDAGSRLLKTQINNDIGAIIPYVGRPPVFFTPQALNPEIYQYKEQLKTAAFEFAGISKMAAQATRPQGIEAAVALRELSDNQSQRFSLQQQRFEQAHVDLGKMIIELAKELHDSGAGAPSVFMSESFVEQIDWPEVDLDRDRFVFNIQPSSITSMTPAGRIQHVIELAQYGVPLRPDEIRRMLGHPDLELDDNRATSALEDAEWVIKQLSDGEYVSPEPFQDLALSVRRVTAAYLDARRNGAPEDVLELMRQWITQAENEMQQVAAMQQPQQAAVSPDVVDPTALAGLTGA